MTIFDQQSIKFSNPTAKIAQRIVSLSQPYLRTIYRGKAGAAYEIGSQADISVKNGLVRLEYLSFDPYNESKNLIPALNRYKLRYGYYPARINVDQIYRTQENIEFCNKHNIEMLGLPLGKPKKDQILDKKKIKLAEIERMIVERRISVLKRRYGLESLNTKTSHTSEMSIRLAILIMNIINLGKLALFLFFYFLYNYCVHFTRNIQVNCLKFNSVPLYCAFLGINKRTVAIS